MNIVLSQNQAALELLSFPKFGDGIGLHRMMYILAQLPAQEWLPPLDALKVTGSKGKGSTSILAASILNELGINTGLFTSPHLFRFNERIKIDNIDITDAQLADSWSWFQAANAAYVEAFPGDTFGYFEAFTSVALHFFAQRRVDTLVSEGGIGGRYDSTRVIPGKTVALTSVELEHTELLGNRLDLIAFDKADLCPHGGALVVGSIDPDLLRRLSDYCRLREVNLIDVTAGSHISDIRVVDHRMEFALQCAEIDFGHVSTNLVGEHQTRNIAVAVTAVWDWVRRNRPEVSTEQFKVCVKQALTTVPWPGRFERICQDPEVVIDVGHTPQSMQVVAETARRVYPSRNILLVVGVSRDKNIHGILRELLPIASAAICTSAHHKGATSTDILAECNRIRPQLPALSIPDLEDAIHLALQTAKAEGSLVLVAGGLFLAIEALVVLRGGDPTALHFA